MLYDTERCFVFGWCTGYNLQKFQSMVNNANASGRVCYISTQKSRIYVVVQHGNVSCHPHTYRDNAWRILHRHRWVVEAFDVDSVKTLDSLKEHLAHQMVKQFRSTVEGYFDILPTCTEVLSTLTEGMPLEQLRALRYHYTDTNVQPDPEWDGGVEILCDDGCIYVPYVEYNTGKELLTKYATVKMDSVFHPITKLLSGVWSRVASICSNMHWSNFRIYVEGKGR